MCSAMLTCQLCDSVTRCYHGLGSPTSGTGGRDAAVPGATTGLHGPCRSHRSARGPACTRWLHSIGVAAHSPGTVHSFLTHAGGSVAGEGLRHAGCQSMLRDDGRASHLRCTIGTTACAMRVTMLQTAYSAARWAKRYDRVLKFWLPCWRDRTTMCVVSR